MRCPRCGADNSERADSCYLCQQPLGDAAAGTEWHDAGENASGQVPLQHHDSYAGGAAQEHAVPPPPVGGGYQPPPPGAYPAGIAPPPPPPKGPATVKIIIGILVAVLIIIIAGGAFFLMRGKTYDIDVPIPPGFKPAEEGLMEDLRKTLKGSPGDIELDELFVDAAMSNIIIVAHQDIPVMARDKPPADDPDAMEKWFYDSKQEWLDAMNQGVMMGSGSPAEIDLYEVERLATGEAVLHMATTVSVQAASFRLDMLWVIKGRSAFFIMLEGSNYASSTIDYLKQNISFRE